MHSCIHELGFGVKMSFCRELDLSRRCVFYSDFYADKRDLAQTLLRYLSKQITSKVIGTLLMRGGDVFGCEVMS